MSDYVWHNYVLKSADVVVCVPLEGHLTKRSGKSYNYQTEVLSELIDGHADRRDSCLMTKANPFRYFNSSPEVICLAVMMYIWFPLSLRNVEDLLHERGIDVSHETIWFWWNRFGPLFARETRRRRVEALRSSNWRWHLYEMFVKISGETHYL